VPKASIAAVQGKCIAGGLLLAWPCDLIVAAENAEFSDPVVFLGIGGVEYHGHAWELGPRKAKEILFTGRAVTAREAEQTGMVNRVVELDRLQDETMDLARHIAQSRCSTSTTPATATRSPAPATRSSPALTR
jgi:enoyl-CoA hydratase